MKSITLIILLSVLLESLAICQTDDNPGWQINTISRENGGVGDGLADAWELFYFGNLTSADPSAIGQADGLTNKEKSDLGLSPLLDLSAASAAPAAKFSYDLVGRLTAVTAAISPVTLVPDAEGNLTKAQ